MSASFDPALNTDKDYVRFLIGDTSTSAWLVQDETIEAILDNEANKFMAAVAVIEALYTGETGAGSLEDRKVGETRIRYQRVSDLKLLTAGLRARGSAHMRPSAGGIYESDKDTYNQDTSLDKPGIAKKLMSNPRTFSSLTDSETT